MNELRPRGPAFLIWKSRILVASAGEPNPIPVTRGDFSLDAPVFAVTTGNARNAIVYLLAAADESAANALARSIAPDAQFVDVMFDLGRYDAATRTAVVRAIAIERWSNRYRFCPACGLPLHWTTDAVAKICTNPERAHRHFPRLDPAIIVLVTTADRALLGRAARFPPGFYSTLAGFVEPGENVEAAVRREVFEEAGIRVGATRYVGSESWPFPRSLMLGFRADAESTAITLHDGELEDARWFSVPELHALQAGMKQARPYFDTIARRLIDAWLTERGHDPLTT